MAYRKPLNCPCCGSTATVEPHLIEAGGRIGNEVWTDWWTASVNCDSCPLQFVGGGDTEEDAVEDALKGWNRRTAVTDEQFAYAVHDGRAWVCVEGALESDELKPIPGFTRDSIYRDSTQEYGEWMEKATALMRDLSKRIPWSAAFYDETWHRSPTDEVLAERLGEFGIEV